MTMRLARLAILGLLPVLTACAPAGGAPSVPLFGSYFPAWILCGLAGIVLAMLLRAVLIGLHIDEHLPAPPLVYLCAAISGGIVIWLVWAGAL